MDAVDVPRMHLHRLDSTTHEKVPIDTMIIDRHHAGQSECAPPDRQDLTQGSASTTTAVKDDIPARGTGFDVNDRLPGSSHRLPMPE